MSTRFRTTVAAAALAVVAFALGGSLRVGAYPAPPASGTLSPQCSSVGPGGSCRITFTVVNPDGSPASGVLAAFTTSNGAVNPGQTTTNANGVATTTFTAGACGTATVTATASDGATAQSTIGVNCGVGLPSTSTLASAHVGGGMPGWALALLIASLATLLGSGAAMLLVRRRPV